MALDQYQDDDGNYWDPPPGPAQEQQPQNPFDPSRVPGGVPTGWAEDFIRRNPNDYHRLTEAYASEIKPKEQPQTQSPQYQTPTQSWTAPAQAPPPAGLDQFMSILMQRAGRSQNVNRNDPLVRQQVDPAAAQMERASRNAFDSIAEKAGPLANLTGERRMMAERSGQAAGQLEAEVIGRIQTQRAQEIEQALTLWGSRLSDEQRMTLERELALLNDRRAAAGQDIQREALAKSNDEFMRELALREWDLSNTWDYNWAGLGG
jgi:hypothetical protein